MFFNQVLVKVIQNFKATNLKAPAASSEDEIDEEFEAINSWLNARVVQMRALYFND
jgi:hypothetical protein